MKTAFQSTRVRVRMKLLVSLLLSYWACGCQASAGDYQAAIAPLLNSDELQVLTEAVNTALNRSEVTLDEHVFQQNSILVLTPKLSKTPQGGLATGQTHELPPRFQLLTDGKVCLLQQVATGTNFPVNIQCAPIATPTYSSTNHWIDSRNKQIPVTIVQPAFKRGKSMPLVILIHGHGGTRHEAGGFTRVAAALAAQGIASVRMDFPGCGDSRESFVYNNLTNMLADIKAAQTFAQTLLSIDPKRIGLLGFSMGGRLALTLSGANKDYRAIGLWAPSVSPGVTNLQNYLGGHARYQQLRAQAESAGFADFTTSWGQAQQLSYQWFTDLEVSQPLQYIRDYDGALMVLYGDQDTVVPPDIAESVLISARQAAPVEHHVISGADHGLGLFSNQIEFSERAVQNTANFFTQNL